MKARRHALILAIIRERSIGTQEDLGEALRSEGIEVTQATLSRDIKELGLIKLSSIDGDYRYSLPTDRIPSDLVKRAERMFEDVISIDFTENMIMIKTSSGTAQGVAAALDELQWKEVVGTVAGDDSILVVVKRRDQVEKVLNRLYKLRRVR